MPISEKTVELNATRAVIEKMRRTHRINAYSLGATQGEEAALGIDVEATDGLWSGGFIQYKRLYLTQDEDGPSFRWHLNRTTHKDQHSLLLRLERLHVPVFYGLPQFDDEEPLRAWTPPSLWEQLFWIPPSALKIPGTMNTHHDLEYNWASGWVVHSDHNKPQGNPVVPFREVERSFVSRDSSNRLDNVKRTFRSLIHRRIRVLRLEGVAAQQYAADVMGGLQLLAVGRQTKSEKLNVSSDELTYESSIHTEDTPLERMAKTVSAQADTPFERIGRM